MSVSRNSPCPCGSGRKYKQCCGAVAPVQGSSATPSAADLDRLLQEGLACHRKGEYQQAELAYAYVLGQVPDHADALHWMGVLAHEFGKHALAADLIGRALAGRRDAGMHFNMGQALRALGRWSEAVEQYRLATEANPAWLDPWVNLGTAELECGRLESARRAWHHALQLEPENHVVLSNLLMASLYDADLDGSGVAELHRQLGARFGGGSKAAPMSRAGNPGRHSVRLTVGLVSGDLRRHPVGLLLQALLPAMAAEGLDLHIYSSNPAQDEVTQALRSRLPSWTDISAMSDMAVRERIAADGIELLVDLSGHTSHNRMSLFASRAAPRQLSWLGYGTTTGLPQMDYILADSWCVRPDEAGQYTEKVLRLPHGRLFYSPPRNAPEVAPLPSLQRGHITFGCFNHAVKLNPRLMDAWARLLRRLPTARLVLKARQYDEALGREHVQGMFEAAGIASDRYSLLGHSGATDYFSSYREIDIALDPSPFNGGMTTLDGLWMGVPCLTLSGDRMIGRQSESILRALSLDEWVASDLDDYVERAVRFAGDTQDLARLRAGLRTRMATSPICDSGIYAVDLAQAFRTAVAS